ncbi:hypothetical protein T06_7934 [Trichinella sp. T6]|nr:hypothetical protein T06_7934 [Trichinella sp. T6]
MLAYVLVNNDKRKQNSKTSYGICKLFTYHLCNACSCVASNKKQRIGQLKSLAKSINGFRESSLGFVASTTTARSFLSVSSTKLKHCSNVKLSSSQLIIFTPNGSRCLLA